MMPRMRAPVFVVLAVGLLLPASASAELGTIFPPGFEDEPVAIRAYILDEPPARVVVAVHPATRPCGGSPEQDGGQIVIDAIADEEKGDLKAKVTLPDPGNYLACAWTLDAAGAVAETYQTSSEIAAQEAEVTTSLGGPRFYRGVPLEAARIVESIPGRVVQTAILRAPCPARAPDAGDPVVVRWLPSPSGTTIGRSGSLRASESFTLDVAGRYQVCTWVGEAAGDPVPEGADGVPLTILPGKAKTVLRLSVSRGRSASDPARWGALVFGAFRGTLFFEGRRAALGRHDRIVGVGRWRPLVRVDLSKLRQTFVPNGASTSLGNTILAPKGTTRLPRAIGACGLEAKIAFVRVRFGGTGLARAAVSKPVELTGTLGGC